MCTMLANISAPFNFNWLQQIVVVNGAISSPACCICAGWLHRAWSAKYKGRSAGVRTNLLICMGAAFFTLLSAVLAGDGSPNKGQVASNIVQGIGFLGAGLIHSQPQPHQRTHQLLPACGSSHPSAWHVARDFWPLRQSPLSS